MEEREMSNFGTKVGRLLLSAGAAAMMLTAMPETGRATLQSDLELVRSVNAGGGKERPVKEARPTKTSPTSPTTTTAPASAPALSVSAWQSEGVHPQAAAQATALGRRIVDLQAFGGKIYAGYGDYQANTGPIAVSALSPGAGYTREFTADTEATYNFRDIGGVLYAPSIDPRVAADFSASTPWSGSNAVEAAHVFDMATTDGSDLWMVGSQDVDAVAWRSLDGGTTWSEELRVSAVNSGEFSRFYFAGVLGGRLYVQAYDSYQGAQAKALVFDGTSWTSAPPIVTTWYNGWRPIEFNGKLVIHGYGKGTRGPIYSYDGVTSTVVTLGYDVEVAGGRLFVLDDAELRVSTDLSAFSGFAAPPAGGRSLAVGDGMLYIGTASSEIFSGTLQG
jgi:hypothetical protein